MKIKTHLKAGNIFDTVSNTATNLVRPATNFVSQANQQARDIAGTVTRTAGSTWNSLTSLVR